jgi:hypothetical protein
MQEVLVQVSTQSSQEENQRDAPSNPVGEFAKRNGNDQMPGCDQNDGQPTHLIVRGWKNLCGKEQVPDGIHPVRHDNQQSKPP